MEIMVARRATFCLTQQGFICYYSNGGANARLTPFALRGNFTVPKAFK